MFFKSNSTEAEMTWPVEDAFILEGLLKLTPQPDFKHGVNALNSVTKIIILY